MTLEDLPNELFSMIFAYLSYHEIIYAFDKLNYRFNSLLLFYPFYSLDIDDPIIKHDFYLGKQLLPDISAIRSLRFKTNEGSFFSRYPLNLFYSSLQSISLCGFPQYGQLITIIRLLPNFKQLKFLSLDQPSCTYPSWISNDRDEIYDIILFQIKTLKSFQWNSDLSIFPEQLKIELDKQSTIEYYKFHEINSDQFRSLYLHTLNLKSIDCLNIKWLKTEHEDNITQKLVCLKLNNISSKIDFEQILNRCMFFPKLKQLQIQGKISYRKEPIDGYQWQVFITNYFPQLEILKFFFTINQWINLELPKELIQSFMTNFWIKEKKWFVNCDFQALSDTTYLYTIPSINTSLQYSRYWTQFSTKISNDISNIEQLTLYSLQSENILSYSRFSYVKQLILKHKKDDITYELIDKVVCLASLQKIYFQSEVNENLFFDLLKHINQHILITIEINNLRSIFEKVNNNNIIYLQKIRYLQVEMNNYSEDFSHEEFLQNIFLCFPNLRQLFLEQHFTISSIIDLLNNLNNLTYLCVSCVDKNNVKEKQIQRLLTKKYNEKSKKNMLCQQFGDTLYIYISNSGLFDDKIQCSLL